MIVYVAPERGCFSIRNYLESDGAALASRFRVIAFEELAGMGRLPLGTYVFAGLDQLVPAELELARNAAERLQVVAAVRILNHPACVLDRLALLEAAYAEGVNSFRAWPAQRIMDGSANDLRYPVFVRSRWEHTGNLSGLVRSRRDLDRTIAWLQLWGRVPQDLLVVEFCDTADAAGRFRKFSSYVVGDTVAARGINAGLGWMMKAAYQDYHLGIAAQEIEFVHGNQHSAWVRTVCQLANVDFGRIDFALLQGCPTVWEVNTNPTIGRAPGARRSSPERDRYRAATRCARAEFYARFEAAWLTVDCEENDGRWAPFQVTDDLRRRIAEERRTRQLITRRRARLAQWGALPIVSAVRRSAKPMLLRAAPLLRRLLVS